MKSLFILGSLASTLLFSSSIFMDLDTTVYICKGPNSKRYHLSKDCRGLKRCSTRIAEVSLDEAKSKKRSLCGYED